MGRAPIRKNSPRIVGTVGSNLLFGVNGRGTQTSCESLNRIQCACQRRIGPAQH